MFRIHHNGFAFVTTDVSLAVERLKQGYIVQKVDYICQMDGKPVKLVQYGDRFLLSY